MRIIYMIYIVAIESVIYTFQSLIMWCDEWFLEWTSVRGSSVTSLVGKRGGVISRGPTHLVIEEMEWPWVWSPGASTGLLLGSRGNAPVGTRELCVRMKYNFQSHLVCTIVTRNGESEQFDAAGGCGREGCVMVQERGVSLGLGTTIQHKLSYEL